MSCCHGLRKRMGSLHEETCLETLKKAGTKNLLRFLVPVFCERNYIILQ